MVGKRIKEVRKSKKLLQAELGALVGTSGDIIGRYERGKMSPSIETTVKIAEALEVSVDYLVGKIDIELNNEMIYRLEKIAERPKKEREFMYSVIDFMLQEYKKY